MFPRYYIRSDVFLCQIRLFYRTHTFYNTKYDIFLLVVMYLRKMWYWLYKTSGDLDSKSSKVLYYSLFHPHLDYNLHIFIIITTHYTLQNILKCLLHSEIPVIIYFRLSWKSEAFASEFQKCRSRIIGLDTLYIELL